ncbi:MAG: hypothetical protein D6727_07970 [Gammaproteobacteria bacterium]|nr:MAG: hypothetical protein D6727_07970 [Gammaproteobacteria bacterium]
MRRLLPLLILAGLFAWLWQLGGEGGRLQPGLPGGGNAGGRQNGSRPADGRQSGSAAARNSASGQAAAALGRHPGGREELRIEIPGDATSAERRHGELIARWGDDPAAVQWVDDCLAERDLNDIDAADDRDWEYACWEAYAQAFEKLPATGGASAAAAGSRQPLAPAPD